MNVFASKQVVNSKREFLGFFQKRTGNLSPSKREFPVALVTMTELTGSTVATYEANEATASVKCICISAQQINYFVYVLTLIKSFARRTHIHACTTIYIYRDIQLYIRSCIPA